jgi:hypothetical protein
MNFIVQTDDNNNVIILPDAETKSSWKFFLSIQITPKEKDSVIISMEDKVDVIFWLND